MLVVSVLLSISFGIEKNNVMDRLNEALATISQQSNFQMSETPFKDELELPEDVEKGLINDLQDIITDYNKKIEDLLKLKEKDLMEF